MVNSGISGNILLEDMGSSTAGSLTQWPVHTVVLPAFTLRDPMVWVALRAISTGPVEYHQWIKNGGKSTGNKKKC